MVDVAEEEEGGSSSSCCTSCCARLFASWTQHEILTLTTRGASCFSIAVLLFEVLAYNLVFLGKVLPAAGKESLVVPCLALFDSLWLMTMWSYVQAQLTDPGQVPDRWHAFVEESRDNMSVVAPRVAPPGWQPGKATHCKKCTRPRPERAHHCAVCGHCVLRYDHHCPWINNCVGLHNHKFFVLLSIYGWLSSFVFLSTTLPQLVQCIGSFIHPPDDPDLAAKRLSIGDFVIFVISICFGMMVMGLLTMLMSIHLPLATKNLTTVEDYYDNMPNPFDQGDHAANLAQIFGAYGPDWVIPIRPLRPLADGVVFPRHDDFRGSDGLPDGIRGKNAREIEDLWKVRYHTRLALPMDGDGASLLTTATASLARWWKSASGQHEAALLTT